ncbi:hypothetical protein GCM10028833_14820 [Glycomyces tarimensis]
MLLLDSQTALWVMDDDPHLGSRSKKRIVESTSVHVSVATVWELIIKSMLGKLKIPTDFAQQVAAQGFGLLDIPADHAEDLRDSTATDSRAGRISCLRPHCHLLLRSGGRRRTGGPRRRPDPARCKPARSTAGPPRPWSCAS